MVTGGSSPSFQVQDPRDTERNWEPPCDRLWCQGTLPRNHGVPSLRPAEQWKRVQEASGADRVGFSAKGRTKRRGERFSTAFYHHKEGCFFLYLRKIPNLIACCVVVCLSLASYLLNEWTDRFSFLLVETVYVVVFCFKRNTDFLLGRILFFVHTQYRCNNGWS